MEERETCLTNPGRRLLFPFLVLLASSLCATGAAASPTSADDVVIPGGSAALRRLLALDPRRPAETLFLEAQEALVSEADAKASWKDVARRRELVGFVEDLAAWRAEFGTTAVFSSDADGKKRTKRALGWLGYRIEKDGKQVSAEPRASATAMRRQRFLDVLGVPTDEFAKKVLAGERVAIDTKDETAPLPFTLAAWKETVPSKELTPQGALVLFAKDVKASRLLVALAAVDEPTRELLKESVGWAAIYRDSDLLGAFTRAPEALSARRGRFVLPGGADAEPVWREVLGVSKDAGPGELARALLTVDNGKAAYVVDALQQIPEPDARAFVLGTTGGGERAKNRFRRLYRAIEGAGSNYERARRDPYDFAHLVRFLRFGDDGEILLPGGGASVWQAALESRTFPRSESDLADVLADAQKRSGSPEEFLRVLFKRTLSAGARDFPAQRRFLIVASLLEERPALADPGLVVLLFRGLDRFHAAYAVLEDLPLEDPAPARRLLFALDRLDRRSDNRERELAIGLFECSLELLAELAHSSTLSPGQTKELLDTLVAVPVFSGETSATEGIETVSVWVFDRLVPAARSIASAASSDVPDAERPTSVLPGRDGVNPDEDVDRALSGPKTPVRFAFRGGAYVFDATTDELERRKEFQRRQHVASLAALREAREARRAMAGPSRAEAVARFAHALDLSGGAGPRGPDERVDRTLERARAAIARGDADAAALDAAYAERLLEALLAHVYAAAAGDPDDLYYQDPDFVRRHSFRTEGVAGQELLNAFSDTALSANVSGKGSRVTGSVFDLADVLGLLHAEQIAYAPEASIPNEEVRAGLVGPVRRMSAALLDEDALLAVAASCRATEELVKALDEKPREERARLLSDAAHGLVAPARLDALAAGGSARLDVLSPTDLYRVGRRLAEGAAPVPLRACDETREALRRLVQRLGKEGARIRLAELGPRAVTYAGRFRLADLEMPSYERLAAYRLPQLFFDRLYDLKVAVARRVSEAGRPVAILPLALTVELDQMLSHLAMSYAYDWQPTVDAARAIQVADVDRLLEAALTAGRFVREDISPSGVVQ